MKIVTVLSCILAVGLTNTITAVKEDWRINHMVT